MKKKDIHSVNEGLPQELKSLVKWSVSILGNVIEEKLGRVSFERIEKTRRGMASIRGAEAPIVTRQLEETRKILSQLSSDEKREFAKSFTLMLELMNACENAYRTHRLKRKKLKVKGDGAEAIYFVLTAHPTESRAPENIGVFHEIQKTLVAALDDESVLNSLRLKSLLEIAWSTEIVRMRKPRVQDEAEHIYSILLRDSNLSVLLDYGRNHQPVYIRSWVGGDKDGHPGVNQDVMSESLQMSRTILLSSAKSLLLEYVKLVGPLKSKTVRLRLKQLNSNMSGIRILKPGDAIRLKKVRESLMSLIQSHENEVGRSIPESLSQLEQLFKIFPGLVVPLELREDSTVLLSDPKGDAIAIGKMLKRIGQFARGEDPCLYVRGMIISMAQSLQHIRVAGKMVLRQVGNSKIPIVPLFEQKSALEQGASIVNDLLKDAKIKKIVHKDWNGVVEVMVGYSDSAKESGVLASRLAILDSIESIDQVCRRHKVKAVFFHGSGGSVDRGGGAIRDQIAGWPRNALNVYKATVQGEMVERTFASPEILGSQIAQIAESTSDGFRRPYRSQKLKSLEVFSNKVRKHYQEMIHHPDFLMMVEQATPYSFLSALKIGSRPTKRSNTGLKVSGLRAIPWVLCWTQTRILFPTWWGIGRAWSETKLSERKKIKKAFQSHSVFKSYIHALGFTLAKIEMPVFAYYLRHSSLASEVSERMIASFEAELNQTRKFFQEITGQKNPMWYRPWLGESIELRTSMIHPLNILEVMAQQDQDLQLLRMTVAGIASGMLTTG
jgi:phosphoenolpyruvate carboxylase